MELALLIWFIETVTKFAGMLQFICFVMLGVVTFMFCIFKAEGADCKAFKLPIIGLAIACTITGLVPSKDTGYTMLAAYGVQTVADNEHVQEFMGDGLAILQLKMKEYKLELEEK